MGKFLFYGLLFIIFVSGIGKCEQSRQKEQLGSQQPYKWNYNMGVETQKKPTRFSKPLKSSGSEYMTKREFYEGMENAEAKGMADDPSAQEIYDEFNR